MPSETTELIDKIGKNVEAMRDRVDEIEKKTAKNEGVSELKGQVDKINDTLDTLLDAKKALEEQQERMAKIEAALRRSNATGENGGLKSEEVEAYKAALYGYIRHAPDRRDDNVVKAFADAPDVRKALSVDSQPNGGYWVDPDTSGRMVKRVFETSPLRGLASVVSISTDALEGPYDDDEASVGWAGERQARSETDTPEIGEWRIPVHEQYGLFKVTEKLIEDAAFDVEAWMADKVADKLARTENTAFVSGNGVGKPRGFLGYGAWASAGTYQRDAIEQIISGSAAALTSDGIIDLMYALKGAYRDRATFAASRLAWREIRQLKDGDGNYLWQPGYQLGQPNVLLGLPTAELNDMPVVAANALALAIADWREAYQIVDRVGLSVLRDPYSSKPYVELYFRRRVGGAVLNFDAIKIQKIAAS